LSALVAVGIITGVTETATGIGGPPLALVYQHQGAARLRSTLAFCFLVSQLMSLAMLAPAGRVSASHFKTALMLSDFLACRRPHIASAKTVRKARILESSAGQPPSNDKKFFSSGVSGLEKIRSGGPSSCTFPSCMKIMRSLTFRAKFIS
jgi:hypothetical protein